MFAQTCTTTRRMPGCGHWPHPVAGNKLPRPVAARWPHPVAGNKIPRPVAARWPHPVAGGKLPRPVAGYRFPQPVAAPRGI